MGVLCPYRHGVFSDIMHTLKGRRGHGRGMEPSDNRYSAGWNRHNPNDLPTHDNRGFRIRPGPRSPALNANVPMIRDWYNQYLEVEDARPGKEQGQTDLWGILEVLIQHIF